MSSTNYTVLLFACLFLAKPAWDVPQEVTPSPETLISRARLHQETWSEGAPPTSLRAELQVSNDRGDLVHGDYTLAWLSTYQWKEAIRIGNYERLRVRDAKGYWQKSTLSYQPEVIFQLDTLLHLKDALKLEGILQMQERIQLKNDFRLVAQRTFLPVAFCIADSEPLIIPNSYGFFPLVSGQPSKGVITVHQVTPVIRNLKFRPQ